MNDQKVIDTMKSLAVEAGKVIMDVYRTDFAVEHKADASPLTLADKKANTIIVTGLSQIFPGLAILSEESKDDKSRLNQDYCFIVDPLDGTKEFIKRNGQFTVNIALSYQGNPIMGVIYVPVTGQLYYASRGAGSYLEDPVGSRPQQLKVTDKTTDLIVAGSKSHASEMEAALIKDHQQIIAGTITAGSSLKGCMIAAGQADVYYRSGLTSEWDTAAMHCIVEEAGGIFRQLDGSIMCYNRENNLNEKGFYIVNRKENIWIREEQQ